MISFTSLAVVSSISGCNANRRCVCSSLFFALISYAYLASDNVVVAVDDSDDDALAMSSNKVVVFLSVDGVEGAFHGYDSDSHLLTGLTLRWGERVQSMMLTHMLLYNLTPHTACNMQNGAPVHVAKSTLRR